MSELMSSGGAALQGPGGGGEAADALTAAMYDARAAPSCTKDLLL